ncbi:MAG: hypothetical protein A2Y23_00275 [Clostridiales bacterium GWB2_37_7]|nr:MAG: hypothetical protein A2Y23_00275 [Clostridiales bacterium GWB2_37_7]
MDNTNQNLISMHELLACLANAQDLVRPELAKHHQRIAYLSYKIGEKLGLSRDQKKDLFIAGLLHDVGALSTEERLEFIEKEPLNIQNHAFKGAWLLEGFLPLSRVAVIIRYHHVPWKDGKGDIFKGVQVPLLSHIIHLADSVIDAINFNCEILEQVKAIQNKILEHKNTVFMPNLVDAFISLSIQEYIWLDINYKPSLNILTANLLAETLELDINGLIDLTKIFANIIDFRSPFTANHSVGVAKTAEKLAELVGFSETECKKMRVAGYLHDLGKLVVSNEILEKPAKLDVSELNSMKSHTYYTYRLLQTINEFETINTWASYHHEKLNGKGYPFHLEGKDISLGSRIMMVADIFTAITEDRPYRKGMTYEQVVAVLNSMVSNQSICPYVVSILIDNFDLIDEIRKEAQLKSSIEYSNFIKVSGD